jgi:hypothetical protein
MFESLGNGKILINPVAEGNSYEALESLDSENSNYNLKIWQNWSPKNTVNAVGRPRLIRLANICNWPHIRSNLMATALLRAFNELASISRI